MAVDDKRMPLNSFELRSRVKELEEQLAEAQKTPEPKGWFNQHIELGKPRWTYLIIPGFGCLTPIAALLAAIMVFWYNTKQVELGVQQVKLNNDNQQFLRNQAEKKEKIDKAIANSKNQETQKLTDAENRRKDAEQQRWNEGQKVTQDNFITQLRQDRDKSSSSLRQQQIALQQQGNQFLEQMKLDRQRLSESQKQFNDQLSANDLRFKIEQVEKEFKDVQDRFASMDAKTRAIAALQLAELAQEPLPGKPVAPFKAASYPFFARAALQFALILPIEQDVEARRAIIKALERLVAFAKGRNETKSESQILLVDIANEFAQGNRAAKDTFIRAMAEYSVVAGIEGKGKAKQLDLNLVASLAPFCDRAETTIICLRELIQEGETRNDEGAVTTQSKYEVQRKVFEEKQYRFGKKKEEDENALRLPALETAAEQLIDMRDALAIVLTHDGLKTPSDYPLMATESWNQYEEANENIESARTREAWLKANTARQNAMKKITMILSFWKRRLPLMLNQCFLSGADLHSACLPGANLVRVQLHGANLKGAQLQRSDLNEAQLQEANLDEAQLQSANLNGVQSQGANFNGAQLESADFRRASLQRAGFNRAKLQWANLSRAQLQEANLYEAQLQEANLSEAQLQDVRLDHAELQRSNLNSAQLQGANLSGAQLQGANLGQAQLQGADLSGAQLQEAGLPFAGLQGADLSRTQLQGTNLRWTQLDRANLYDAFVQLENTREYKMTEFTGSSYSHAEFTSTYTMSKSKDSDMRTAKLVAWLKQFPQMPEMSVITYEVWKAKTKGVEVPLSVK